MADDARLYAPSTARNREPIFEVLQPLLPSSGLVLEIASGAGEHIVGLAAASSTNLKFQPTDPDAQARESIDAWRRELNLPNVRPAIALDATAPQWPLECANVVICINMIHISPWSATEGLFRNAARMVPAGGVLFTYGPYKRDGAHTSPGNEAFDADLRKRDASWGIRDVADVARVGTAAGFADPDVVSMPANNLSLVFRKL
jgi:Protein of unknown function (DUF938)